MEKPRFSIIIPTLNEEKFLPKLLTSLAGQTQKNFEVVVVDGLSKDKTVEVARTFASKIPKLQVVMSEKARLPLQRNLGAKHTTGEWLIFVDADSVLMPYFIERVKHFIDTQKSAVFTTWVKPDTDDVNDSIFTLIANIFLESTILFKRPFTPGPLTIIRRNLFELIGGYDETRKFNEDVDFGLRLAKAGAVADMLRETLYVWSMRRIRREGKVKVIQQMVVASLPVLLFKRPLKYMPGYVMGGQLYGKKKRKLKLTVLKRYEKELKKLLTELFE